MTELSHAEADQMLAQWRELEQTVTQMVQKAQADPDYRASLGISTSSAPKLDVMTGRAATADDDNPQAELLRSCAAQVIPKHFEYEVVSAIGGKAFLTLKGLRPREE